MAKNIFIKRQIQERRVVITGAGAITPAGLNLESSWEHIVNGKSCIEKITSFEPSHLETQIAGEVKGFNPDLYIPKKDQKKMARFIQLSLAATQMALDHSGINMENESIRENIAAIVGVGMGGLHTIEQQAIALHEKGPRRVSPFFIPSVITNLASGQISIKFGTKGGNFAVTSACASGSHALGEAYLSIKSGINKIAITGGSEATVTQLAIAGFNSMKALSTKNETPSEASRPWDKGRDGFVLSEGSAMFILEDYEHASIRGANILAEVVGYGISSDAYHMTSPAPGGAGASLAMQRALADAQLEPSQIDYINAHGTSTPAGDLIESQAIENVFKDHKSLLVSSTKSMTGHALGAAGAIESALCLKALQTGIAPPTINLDNPEEEISFDMVAHKAKEKQMSYVLNNSFGFGGTNACLIFGKI